MEASITFQDGGGGASRLLGPLPPRPCLGLPLPAGPSRSPCPTTPRGRRRGGRSAPPERWPENPAAAWPAALQGGGPAAEEEGPGRGPRARAAAGEAAGPAGASQGARTPGGGGGASSPSEAADSTWRGPGRRRTGRCWPWGTGTTGSRGRAGTWPGRTRAWSWSRRCAWAAAWAPSGRGSPGPPWRTWRRTRPRPRWTCRRSTACWRARPAGRSAP